MFVKNLFRNIILLSGACLLTMLAVIVIFSPVIRNDKAYMAASIDKEYQLSMAPSPRLVFVGGSNLALGLNSRQIESALDMHVVNMGLHAGLGLSYPLNEAQAGLQRGDLIVLSIEHFLGESNKKLTANLINSNPTARKFLDLSFFNSIRLYIQYVQLCLSSSFYKTLHINQIDPIYNRKGFTINGDLISHFGRPKPVQLRDNVTFVATDYSESIKEINQFIETARSKGALVLFTYPAFPISAYKSNKRSLVSLSSQYNKLLKCPILGSVETFVLPDKYFFDTVYHLDSTGIQKRTEIMIGLLQRNGMKLSIK